MIFQEASATQPMPGQASPACRICGSSGPHEKYTVREMMFGTGESFDYFECACCGCLQIGEIPSDLSRHYPDTYYSYHLPTLEVRQPNFVKEHLKRARLNAWLKNGSSSVLVRAFGKPWIEDRFFAEISKIVPLRATARIVDFGCGNGHRLLQWRIAGFANLMGIDPFIEDDIDYGNGVRVLKRGLDEMPPNAYLVMGHHSFEHIPDGASALSAIHEKLQPHGWVALAIPVCDSYAWQFYRTEWVALDAPRHLHLHTTKSLTLLAQRCGFSVEKVVRNSTAMQFWGSEQYRAGIPLMDERSYATNPVQSLFSPAQIEEWQAQSEVLNAEGRGDWATFYLRKQRN